MKRCISCSPEKRYVFKLSWGFKYSKVNVLFSHHSSLVATALACPEFKSQYQQTGTSGGQDWHFQHFSPGFPTSLLSFYQHSSLSFPIPLHLISHFIHRFHLHPCDPKSVPQAKKGHSSSVILWNKQQ